MCWNLIQVNGTKCVLSIKYNLSLLEMLSWPGALITLFLLWRLPVFFHENEDSKDIETLGFTPLKSSLHSQQSQQELKVTNFFNPKKRKKMWQEIITHYYSLVAYQKNKDYFSISTIVITTPTKYFFFAWRNTMPLKLICHFWLTHMEFLRSNLALLSTVLI